MKAHQVLTQGLASGLVGTTTMTATTFLETRLRPGLEHPIDYDVSDAPAIAASRVLGLDISSDKRKRAAFALVHWGYGSLVGAGQVLINRKVASGPAATLSFFAAIQTMAFLPLPALGGTPPPRRWSKDVVATSLVQHAIYALAVSSTSRVLDRRS